MALFLAGLALASIQGVAAQEITAAPQLDFAQRANLATGTGAAACATADLILSICASINTGWANFPATKKAQCLCCDDSSYYPFFETEASLCARYITSAFPLSSSDYSVYSSVGTYCAKYSTVCGGGGGGGGTVPTITIPPTTTLPTTTPGSTPAAGGAGAACNSLIGIVTSCVSKVPGYTDLPVPSQAKCACYTTKGSVTSWIPDTFDGYAKSCASYAKTADPSDYSIFSGLQGFCTAAGDVLAAATATGGGGGGGGFTIGGDGTSVATSTRRSTVVITPSPTVAAAAGTNTRPALNLGPVWFSAAALVLSFGLALML